ncbi:MAG: thioredoxin family protein [Proteobacteria bacterium]|nr:thioredoxin family protein [Pseudomonadota bacterium]
MNLGAVIFSFIVGMVVLSFAAQFAMARKSKAAEGKPAPELDGAIGQAVRGSTVLWFHSPTCGPCRSMEPTANELQAAGKLHVVDVSKRMDIAMAFGVMATPTTIQVVDGQVELVQLGVLPPDRLMALAG